MLGKTALKYERRLADDEGSDIREAFVRDVVASFVDIFTGNAAYGVCNAGNVGGIDADLVRRLITKLN